MKFTDKNGHYLPWSSDGTFVWLTDDRTVIHRIGEMISMDLPNGDDDEFPISYQDRKHVGELMAAAPMMLNLLIQLAEKGNPDAREFIDLYFRLFIERTKADSSTMAGEGAD